MNVAFYSYKGGVGRTQLVANLAKYLFLYENKKVLLMDWDLEAPGLHFYFQNPQENRQFSNQDFGKNGLIDLLNDYVSLTREKNPWEITSKDQMPHIDLTTLISIEQNPETGAKIDLFPAGAYANFREYRKKIIDFDWFEFYEMLDGIRYLEYVIKPQLKEELGYDFVLIDSRTGISDYQNISNIQMADANIIVIAPNMQNLEGCVEMAESIINSKYITEDKRRDPIVMPVLSRAEVDSPDFSEFDKEFRKQCKPILENLKKYIDFSEHDYYENTRLYYNKYIAIGEHLLFENTQSKIDGFAKQIEHIANYLVYGYVKNAFVNTVSQQHIELLIEMIHNNRIAEVFEILDNWHMDGYKRNIYENIRHEFIVGANYNFYDRLIVFIKTFGNKRKPFRKNIEKLVQVGQLSDALLVLRTYALNTKNGVLDRVISEMQLKLVNLKINNQIGLKMPEEEIKRQVIDFIKSVLDEYNFD